MLVVDSGRPALSRPSAKVTSDKLKLTGAVLLPCVATFFVVRFMRQGPGVPDRVFFYDPSERKLFTAARTLVPPSKESTITWRTR